jgi:RsiW-degrading membrane proteinase PrsW (M82 family)
MLEFASIFLGVAPMVLFAILIWRIDRWETEPFPLVVGGFLWGALPSIFFAIISQTILEIPVYLFGDGATESFVGNLYMLSIVAPITEEISKGVGLILVFIVFKKQIHSVLDGIIYGSVVGFGFSAVEDTIYYLSVNSWQELFELFLFRSVITGLCHSIFTGAIGAGFALGLFSKNRYLNILWPVIGFGIGLFMHIAYNTLCVIDSFYESIFAGIILIITYLLVALWYFTIIIFCLYRENTWIRIQLNDEVKSGILTAKQANDAASIFQRSIFSFLINGLQQTIARSKLLQLSTRLAYEKQICQMRLESISKSPEIQILRKEVKELSIKDFILNSHIDMDFESKPPPLPPARHMPPPLP